MLQGDRAALLRSRIRDVPDFPKPGILFKDITPLLADPKAFTIVLDAFQEAFVGAHVDVVVAIESRGFIFGGALAARMGCAFVPVRKPGKLPYHVDRVQYALEYGEGTLEMHKESIRPESRVLVVDDLLATGGTAKGAAQLVSMQGGRVIGFAFVIELAFLEGRKKLDAPATCLLQY